MKIRRYLQPAALAVVLALATACGGGDGGGGSNPPPGGNNPPPTGGGDPQPPAATPDTKPDVFSFASVGNLFLDMAVVSGTVAIKGIDAPTAITVSGGEYAINNQPFTSAAGRINVGDTVRVRTTTAGEPETTVKTVLDIGGVKGAFAVTTGPAINFADIDPDPFQLAEPAVVEKGKLVTSDVFTVTGINAPAPISVVGGEYRIENGEFTSEPGVVFLGQRVQVRATAPQQDGAIAVATLRIGSVVETFVLATAVAAGQPDTIPDVFTFAPVLNAEPGADVDSATLAIEGITADASITIEGGQYALNGNGFTDSPDTLGNGAELAVRVRSSSVSGGVETARVNIGGVTGYFTVITRRIEPGTDFEPEPSSLMFDAVDTTSLGIQIESDWRTVTGFDAPAEVGIEGGEYRIGAGEYTSEPQLILPGQNIRVRGVSPETENQSQVVALTIGGVTSDFVINTVSAVNNQPPVIEATVENCIRDIDGLCVIDNGAYHVSFESDGVILDATGSSDPDGDELSIEWTVEQGHDGIDELVTEDVNGNPLPTGYVGAVFNTSGEYIFRVTVSDGQVSEFEDVVVLVDPPNAPPEVDIEFASIFAFEGNLRFDASGLPFDSDNDELVFTQIAWVQTDGPESLDILVSDTDPMGLATATYTARGVYTFDLHVTLESGEPFVFGFVVDTTEPDVSGVDVQAVPGTGTIELRGERAYSDNEGFVTDVRWEFVDGPEVLLVEDLDDNGSAEASYSTPGIYTFNLHVTAVDSTNQEKEFVYEYVVDATATPDDPPTAVIDVLTATPTVGLPVELDGSRSFDNEDGTITTYFWSIENPDGTLTANGSNETISFTPDMTGTWRATLYVTDNDGNTANASTEIQVESESVVQAVLKVNGADPGDNLFSLSITDRIILNAGTSSSPSGAPLSYTWLLDQNHTGVVVDRTTTFPFVTSFNVSVPAVYQFAVDVSDGTSTTRDRVTVAVVNSRPVADIEASDPTPSVNETVVLDASASFDPDEVTPGALTFDWTLLSKPQDSLTDIQTSTLPQAVLVPDKAGDYEIGLVVTDEFGVDSTMETITITAVEPLQAVIAITPQTPRLGDAVTLDATQSTGNIVSYRWDFSTAPPGADPTIDPNASVTTFTATVDGTYMVELEVVDGDDRVQIVSTPFTVTP